MAFPAGFHEAVRIPPIERAFLDRRGRPLTESPAILAAQGERRRRQAVQRPPAGPFAGGACGRRGPLAVEDVWTAPPFRRRGVALAPLRQVTARAEAEGWSGVLATVWIGNDASAGLVAAAGFETESWKVGWGPRRPVPPLPPPPRRRRRRKWLGDAAAVAVLTLRGWLHLRRRAWARRLTAPAARVRCGRCSCVPGEARCG